MTISTGRDLRRADAAAGATLAVLGLLLVASWPAALDGTAFDGARELVGYAVVWLPLGAAALIASRWHGSGSLRRDFGLRFRPIDLVWGLAIGLLGRTVATVLEIVGYGQVGSVGGVTLGPPSYDPWWLFGTLLAPVLIAPLVEELFFRGLVLRSVLAATPGRAATGVAIGVSGLSFALLHVVSAGSPVEAVVVGAGTLLFGLAAASASMLTGRIGAAIVAHVVFNALVIVPAL
ncbi:CPBP family intramembrane glutamic endopeptidase [Cryobacterium glaciale]|uniref:CPBP family intramembrane glutamic endopeptidase n=1 Tax=Cryobacterium glaciale TaxID=1259145 RepID=UPI00141BB554|nr:CPBP family intramembrane glutamic endopeptidase [Cryobacterium glaciale]